MKYQILNPQYGYSPNDYGGICTISATVQIVTDDYDPSASPPAGSVLWQEGISTAVNVSAEASGWYLNQVIPALEAQADKIVNQFASLLNAVLKETGQTTLAGVLSDVVAKVSAALPAAVTGE